jgi:hypothetical protein
MVNHCANPGCGKPLHYLREGRIYVFDVKIGATVSGRKRERHIEHYWLCGACAGTLTLIQDAHGWIRILAKPSAVPELDDSLAPAAGSELAS